MSIGPSLSVGGLAEDEFKQRINQASGGQIQVTFMQCKNKQPSLLVSYALFCLKSLPSLLKQDVLIADGIGLPGVIVCLFSELFRKKSMITIHGHYTQEWAIRKHSVVKTVLFRIGSTFILRFADLFVVNDQQIKQDLIDKGVKSWRLFTRYVFADTQKFSRGNVNQEQLCKFRSLFKVPEKYILYIGRLNDWDGANDMLEIIKRIHGKLDTAKFVLIGEGPLRPRVNSFIAENDLTQVVFQLERVDHEAMPFIYYGAEIVILPMHPPQSGVGRITLEVLSMEVPLIAYDAGELYRVVKSDETGYLVPIGDTDLIAMKAIALLTNPELKRKLGINGRKLVQSAYDVEIYISNWLQSLCCLCSKMVVPLGNEDTRK